MCPNDKWRGQDDLRLSEVFVWWWLSIVIQRRVHLLCCTSYSDAEGQSFEIKKGCQSTKALSCDLTAETPSIHDVHYYAEVLVNGTCYGRTNRFKPIAESKNLHSYSCSSLLTPSQMYSPFFVSAAILGAPTLSLHTTVSSLHVNVTLPLGPNGVSIADIINKSKNGPSKPVAVYILKITHPKWAAQVSLHSNNRAYSMKWVIVSPKRSHDRSKNHRYI